MNEFLTKLTEELEKRGFSVKESVAEKVNVGSAKKLNVSKGNKSISASINVDFLYHEYTSGKSIEDIANDITSDDVLNKDYEDSIEEFI